MKILAGAILFAWLMGYAGLAYAQCSTQTYVIDGKLIVCTTCCVGGNCSTTCV